MLASKHIPTHLIMPSERPTLPIFPLEKPSRWRPFRIAFSLFALLVRLLWLICIRKLDRVDFARRVRLVLEQFGPLWIRVGQLLSLRADLFSADVCRELALIRNTGDGIPFEDVRRIIEQELERPLESTFEHFAERPFVATSLTQLHRAYLRPEKVWVVVSIIKPYADRIFAQDMRVIRVATWLLKYASMYSNMRWDDLGWQLQDMMSKELDFRFEASSLRRLKKKLRRHQIYVPDTYSDYCTRRMMVTEFIHGALMSDMINLTHSDSERLKAWLIDNKIRPRRVARRLFDSVYRQIFENNYFHADLHPGNIVLLRNSRIAIINCGIVGSLEGALLTKYRLFLQAVANKQYGVAADTYFLLVTSLPVVDMSEVKAALMRNWRLWETKAHIKELPYTEKSITAMFDSLNTVVFQYDFAAQWSLSKLIRAWANLDASLLYLYPKMNYLNYLRRYFQQARQRGQKRALRRISDRVPRSINAVQKLPSQVSEYMLFQQDILRRKAQVVQGKTTKAGAVLATLLGVVELAAGLLIALLVVTFCDQYLSYPIEHIVGRQLTAFVQKFPVLLSGWLWVLVTGGVFYVFMLTRKMRKHFLKEEISVPDISAGM